MTRGFIGVLLICAVAAVASVNAQVVSGSMGFAGKAFMGPAVTGAPYSAQQVMEHTQTLADGTNIVEQPRTTMMYRDSQGRTRTERNQFFGPNEAASPIVTEIRDPVTGYQYTLDTQAHVAHRVAMTTPNFANRLVAGNGGVAGTAAAMPAISTVPPPPPPPPPTASGQAMTGSMTTASGQNIAFSRATVSGAASKFEHTTEQLGTQVLEGVSVTGTRTTRTVPVGAQGNDRPLTTVIESWWSPDLKMQVLSKTTDPRNGQSVIRLTNIVVGEPDPGLFQPPPDYSVVDETGPFQIQFTRPQ